jgi:hypothetical protein
LKLKYTSFNVSGHVLISDQKNNLDSPREMMLVVFIEGSGHGKTALIGAITAAAASIGVTVMLDV